MDASDSTILLIFCFNQVIALTLEKYIYTYNLIYILRVSFRYQNDRVTSGECEDICTRYNPGTDTLELRLCVVDNLVPSQ